MEWDSEIEQSRAKENGNIEYLVHAYRHQPESKTKTDATE